MRTSKYKIRTTDRKKSLSAARWSAEAISDLGAFLLLDKEINVLYFIINEYSERR